MTTPLETLTLCAGAGDFPIESITATNFVFGVGVTAAGGVGALVTGTGVDVVVEGGIVVVVPVTGDVVVGPTVVRGLVAWPVILGEEFVNVKTRTSNSSGLDHINKCALPREK